MATDDMENEPATEEDDSSWRIPTGLTPPSGLQPSPGLAPPQLSTWTGFEPDGTSEVLSVEPAAETVAAAPPESESPTSAAPDPAEPDPGQAAPDTPLPASPSPAVSSVTASTAAVVASAVTTAHVTTAVTAATTTQATAARAVASAKATAAPAAAAATGAAATVAKTGSAAAKAGSGAGKAIGGLAIGALVLGGIFGIANLGSDAENPGGANDSPYSDDALGAVEQYFDALMMGDPSSAVGLLSESNLETLSFAPLDTEAAPDGQIADVEYGEVSDLDTSATVEVSYTLGGEHASTLLSLEQTDLGWRITNGAVWPQAEVFEGFPVTINGKPVTGGAPALLPGVYELGFGDNAYELPETQRRMVIHLSDGEVFEKIDATPQLSRTGADRFTSALRTQLDECLGAGTMTTECGMDLDEADFPDGYELGGVVTRALDPDFDAVLAEHPPQLERDANGFTGRVVLPAEFTARIDLQVRQISDGSLRTGHMRDPEPSLRPRAYLNDGSVSFEWFSPEAS